MYALTVRSLFALTRQQGEQRQASDNLDPNPPGTICRSVKIFLLIFSKIYLTTAIMEFARSQPARIHVWAALLWRYQQCVTNDIIARAEDARRAIT